MKGSELASLIQLICKSSIWIFHRFLIKWYYGTGGLWLAVSLITAVDVTITNNTDICHIAWTLPFLHILLKWFIFENLDHWIQRIMCILTLHPLCIKGLCSTFFVRAAQVSPLFTWTCLQSPWMMQANTRLKDKKKLLVCKKIKLFKFLMCIYFDWDYVLN